MTVAGDPATSSWRRCRHDLGHMERGRARTLARTAHAIRTGEGNGMTPEAKIQAVRTRWNLPLRRHPWNAHHTFLCECLDPGGRHLGELGGSYRCQDCECEDYRETVCAQCGKSPEEAARTQAMARVRKAPTAHQPLLDDEERQQLAALLERWP